MSCQPPMRLFCPLKIPFLGFPFTGHFCIIIPLGGDRMGIAERLKEARIEKNIKQDDLAYAVGASVKTIQRWESGQSTPNAKKIDALALALGTTGTYLLSGEKPHAPHNARPVRGGVIEVPVLSSESTACFSNQIEESDILRYAIIPREWLDGPEGDKTPYIFYIQRDSMDPLIKNGEGLLINPNLEVTHGKIAICCWNGYVMVRGVFFEPNGDIRLLAKNPAYEDVIITAEYAPNVLKFGGVITTCIGRARPIKGFF